MRDTLPVPFEGHAPIELHSAFETALWGGEGWTLGKDEPFISFGAHRLPISVVFGRMRDCSDILPLRLQVDLEQETGQPVDARSDTFTYSDAALVLRRLCVEQLKASMPRFSTLSAAQINAGRCGRRIAG